jgi:Sec-independent protein translocase protein TatA
VGFIGVSGVVLLVVLALLFFGVKRLPGLVRSGRVGAKEFKDSAAGVSGLSSEVPPEPAPLPPVPPPAPVPDVPEAD